MKALYNRLLEICADQGLDKQRHVDIQTLTGLSSGRVTQIKQEGGAAKLGDDALRKLMRLGYSPDWVQEGTLPKMKTEVPIPAIKPRVITYDAIRRMIESILKEHGIDYADLVADDTAAKRRISAKLGQPLANDQLTPFERADQMVDSMGADEVEKLVGARPANMDKKQ